MITVNINGAPRQLPTNATLSDLIKDMGLEGKRIAVECNGEIVPRSTFTSHPLHQDDTLEIVVAVGGG